MWGGKARGDFHEVSLFRIPKAVEPFSPPFVCDGDFFDALCQIFRTKQSGIVTACWESTEKRFLLQQQEIVAVQSGDWRDGLIGLLAERKIVDAGVATQPDLDVEALVNVLLTAARIGSEDLKEAYRTFLKRSVASVFLWPSSKVAFVPARIINEPPATVSLAGMLGIAARSWLHYEALKGSIPIRCEIQRTPQFQEAIKSLRLDPEEASIASLLTGEVNLETLVRTTGIPQERIVRALFLLHRTHAIQFGASEVKPPLQALNLEPVRIEAVKSEKEIENDQEPKTRPQDPDEIILLAQKAFEENNFWRVTQLCDEAIRIHPEGRFFFLKALAYKRHPKFRKDAEDAFHDAIRYSPENADFHMSLARFYMTHHLPIRARTHCERALSIVPNHAEAVKLSYEILNKKPGKGECWCVSKTRETGR